jgi:hypothetical protein
MFKLTRPTPLAPLTLAWPLLMSTYRASSTSFKFSSDKKRHCARHATDSDPLSQAGRLSDDDPGDPVRVAAWAAGGPGTRALQRQLRIRRRARYAALQTHTSHSLSLARAAAGYPYCDIFQRSGTRARKMMNMASRRSTPGLRLGPTVFRAVSVTPSR